MRQQEEQPSPHDNRKLTTIFSRKNPDSRAEIKPLSHCAKIRVGLDEHREREKEKNLGIF
jgi:hypothetical protein